MEGSRPDVVEDLAGPFWDMVGVSKHRVVLT